MMRFSDRNRVFKMCSKRYLYPSSFLWIDKPSNMKSTQTSSFIHRNPFSAQKIQKTRAVDSMCTGCRLERMTLNELGTRAISTMFLSRIGPDCRNSTNRRNAVQTRQFLEVRALISYYSSVLNILTNPRDWNSSFQSDSVASFQRYLWKVYTLTGVDFSRQFQSYTYNSPDSFDSVVN